MNKQLPRAADKTNGTRPPTLFLLYPAFFSQTPIEPITYLAFVGNFENRVTIKVSPLPTNGQAGLIDESMAYGGALIAALVI